MSLLLFGCLWWDCEFVGTDKEMAEHHESTGHIGEMGLLEPALVEIL